MTRSRRFISQSDGSCRPRVRQEWLTCWPPEKVCANTLLFASIFKDGYHKGYNNHSKDVFFVFEDLLNLEKTSSGSAREKSKCDINKVLMGKVGMKMIELTRLLTYLHH